MLRELSIQNFGIVSSAQVEFFSGFHVISGETGSGKSILTQAIAFGLGSRADADWVRAGSSEAVVTLTFEEALSPPVQEFCQNLGLSLEEEILVLRRSVSLQGKSKAYLNDQSITLKSLQNLGRLLVHQVSQHASQQLFSEAFLKNWVDVYGKNQNLVLEYKKSLEQFRQSRENLEELEKRVQNARQQEDFLKFQHQELESVHLVAGEFQELEQKKSRLKNRAQLASLLQQLMDLLLEADDSASDQIRRAFSLAEKSLSLDSQLEPIGQKLGNISEIFRDLESDLQNFSQQLQEATEDFDQLESRRAQLQELQRKYRCDEAGLIQKLGDLKQQLSDCENFELRLEECQNQLEQSSKSLRENAEKLLKQRQKQASELSQKLKKTLRDLALPEAQLVWNWQLREKLEAYQADGGENLSLEVSFNPGETPRPLEEVASGGELSRLLLAFYEVFFREGDTPTLIFDEVDAGVGGKVAELIGRKLELLSQKAQVFCITHLPQIASLSKWHYFVEKKVDKGRTFSKVGRLEGEARVQEIARMLAGVEITAKALEHARDLLKAS